MSSSQQHGTKKYCLVQISLLLEVCKTLSNGRSTELVNRTFRPRRPSSAANSVLAADEGLRGRNVLFTNSVLRPLLKVSQTSIYPT